MIFLNYDDDYIITWLIIIIQISKPHKLDFVSIIKYINVINLFDA